jgi:HTH-type transcriptional regulator/antitoxin HipB
MSLFLAKTPEQLGNILKGYRQQRQLTQAALAARLGLPQKTISLIENHPGTVPLARLFALMGALDIELRVGEGGRPASSKVDW